MMRQPRAIWCDTCERDIPIHECVEVQAGLLKHANDNGYIHGIQ